MDKIGVCSLHHPHSRSAIKLAWLGWKIGIAQVSDGLSHLIPAANLLMQGESRRQSCLKIDLFSGGGMVEFQKLGMQKISSIPGKTGEIFKRLAG